ncbi:MAG: shikimate kinase [Bacillota bacterium]
MAGNNYSDQNIILIGMMATGKSAVGKELAARLSRKYLDTDQLVEEKAGMTVAEIFASYGESEFRKYESEIIAGLPEYPRGSLVVATGGGAVISEKNRVNLGRAGLIVLLTADPEVIVSRALLKGERPLLMGKDPEAKVKKIIKEREPYYQCYNLCLNTDQKSIEELASEIIEKLKSE